MKQINCKEDLIGESIECYFHDCKDKIPITKDGVIHSTSKHWFHFSLEQYYELYLYNIETKKKFAKMMLYGETITVRQEETFYFVNLANSDDTIHTLGKKSRLSGKIYLCGEDYEVDLTKPIEETDFHFVRNSTSFDL